MPVVLNPYISDVYIIPTSSLKVHAFDNETDQ